ncbi:hypothetical protein ACGVWS_04835 [Enterobacteriaceae bacterium LUAb1]
MSYIECNPLEALPHFRSNVDAISMLFKVFTKENIMLVPMVLIWYPCQDFPFGHVAISIYKEEKSVFFSDDSDDSNVTLVPYNHLSFYADNGAINRSYVSLDLETENIPEPHRIYKLYHLNVAAMLQEMDRIFIQPPPYSLFSNNCAAVTGQVLKAGGACYPPSHLIWTPKDIARWCDKLRDKHRAGKLKTSLLPKWGMPVKTLLRLR